MNSTTQARDRQRAGRASRSTAATMAGALAGLALTGGLLVGAAGSASARNCDIGASACRGATDGAATVRYP